MRFMLSIILLLLPIISFENSTRPLLSADENKIHNGLDAHLSILVTDNLHNIDYQKNKDQFFTPASITKLFTASTALLVLKPDFKFYTSLYLTGKIKQGTLAGNVYIKFTGDPTLTSKQLNTLILQLKKNHIHSINGHLYIDANSFDNNYYPSGTTVDDINFNYAAPISSVIINRNAFNILIHITPSELKKVTLSSPTTPSITYHNKLKLEKSPDCTPTINSNMLNNYTLQGCIKNPNKAEEITLPLAIRNPLLSADKTIVMLLKQNSISAPHGILYASTPDSARLLAQTESPPLSKLINQMLKHSDNLIANSLTKTLGHLKTGKPGSWRSGVNVIKETLADRAHINPEHIHLLDGAGISRYNLTTAQTIAHLLQFIQKTPVLEKYLIPALPIAGHDGTLTYRMKNLHHNESFRAKTGTLTGVSNLAGYLTTRNNKHYIVVILADNFTSKANSIRQIEDKMVLALANQ